MSKIIKNLVKKTCESVKLKSTKSSKVLNLIGQKIQI